MLNLSNCVSTYLLRFLGIKDLLSLSKVNHHFNRLLDDSYHFSWRLNLQKAPSIEPLNLKCYTDFVVGRAKRYQAEVTFLQSEIEQIQSMGLFEAPTLAQTLTQLQQQLNTFFVSGDEALLPPISVVLESINSMVADHQLQQAAPLHISLKHISRLPEACVQKHLDKLKQTYSLQLNDNCLETLPKNIKECQSLVSLSLYNNPIASLPQGFENLRVKFLYFSGGYFSSIPPCVFQLKKLQWLSLINMGIQSLSDQIANLKKLTWLNLSENHLRVLPEGLTRLPLLQEIFLEKNDLRVNQSYSVLAFLKRLRINIRDLLRDPTGKKSTLQQEELKDVSSFAKGYLPLERVMHQDRLSKDDDSTDALCLAFQGLSISKI